MAHALPGSITVFMCRLKLRSKQSLLESAQVVLFKFNQMETKCPFTHYNLKILRKRWPKAHFLNTSYCQSIGPAIFCFHFLSPHCFQVTCFPPSVCFAWIKIDSVIYLLSPPFILAHFCALDPFFFSTFFLFSPLLLLSFPGKQIKQNKIKTQSLGAKWNVPLRFRGLISQPPSVMAPHPVFVGRLLCLNLRLTGWNN